MDQRLATLAYSHFRCLGYPDLANSFLHEIGLPPMDPNAVIGREANFANWLWGIGAQETALDFVMRIGFFNVFPPNPINLEMLFNQHGPLNLPGHNQFADLNQPAPPQQQFDQFADLNQPAPQQQFDQFADLNQPAPQQQFDQFADFNLPAPQQQFDQFADFNLPAPQEFNPFADVNQPAPQPDDDHDDGGEVINPNN